MATRLKRGTAWSIIARYLRHGDVTSRPRGGRTTNKLDNESRDLLVMCLEDEPQLTLKQLALILQETWPEKPSVSSSTIYRALHGECITIKVIPQPAERNSDRVKDARHEFASWTMTTGLARHRVCTDESGFNIHLMRTRGRVACRHQSCAHRVWITRQEHLLHHRHQQPVSRWHQLPRSC